MYAMIREASAWRDLAEVIKCITKYGLDPRHVCLVTDDRHCETLLKDGHMDDVVRRAIEEAPTLITSVEKLVLDACCGMGRFSDILIKNGAEVVSFENPD